MYSMTLKIQCRSDKAGTVIKQILKQHKENQLLMIPANPYILHENRISRCYYHYAAMNTATSLESAGSAVSLPTFAAGHRFISQSIALQFPSGAPYAFLPKTDHPSNGFPADKIQFAAYRISGRPGGSFHDNHCRQMEFP